MRVLRICMTLRKSCALAGDAWPKVSNFIWPRPAPKCRPSLSRMAIGKLCSMPARFRCHPVVERASVLDAVWCKKARPRLARRIAISKAAWATDALVYLGSPAVVAASALAGFICAPKDFAERAAGTAIRRTQSKLKPPASVEIMAGFPPSVRGRVLFIDKDNLNTDGIYGSK